MGHLLGVIFIFGLRGQGVTGHLRSGRGSVGLLQCVFFVIYVGWSGPSFLDDPGRRLGRAGRAGWLVQDRSTVLRGGSGLTDTGHSRGASPWEALGGGQRQPVLGKASFCGVGWDFKEVHCGSAPSLAGSDDVHEAFVHCPQVGVFAQVDWAEQHLQKGHIKRLLQFGENVVCHSGHGDHISTGFHRLHVHSLGDEGFVSEAFEEGKWLEYGIGDIQLLKDEVLPKSL